MRRLALQIVLVAFIFSCGGQWYLLQAIAWANMIREYSASVPLTKAVEMTLSGEYPCPICKAIAEHKKSIPDKLASLSQQEKKITSLGVTVPIRNSLATSQIFLTFHSSLRTRRELPPLPPPRLA